MLTLINDPKEVKKLYAEFSRILQKKSVFSEHLAPFALGFQAGTAAKGAEYSPKLDIWVHPGNLSWNAFGLGKVPTMVVQINFQDYAKKPRRAGAAFALDALGQPVLVHRGHIAGGKPGIGLGRMMERYPMSGRDTLQEEDGILNECFVVGELRSADFGIHLARFVRQVQLVKKNADEPLPNGLGGIASSLLKIDGRRFSKEKTTGGYRVGSLLDPTRHHGIVVDELVRQLETYAPKRGWKITNDAHRDIMLAVGAKLTALFEIKTKTNSQDVCTALGQLLIYSASVTATTALVMVLPEVLPADLTKKLSDYRIKVLYYEWREENPHFKELAKLLKSI